MFVGRYDGYAVGIEICNSVDGWWWGMGVMRGGEEAEEGAGGEVGVAFCLCDGGQEVSRIGQEGGRFGMVRTVSMMPFPALDRIRSMLDANVRKVDWVLLVVTTVWGVGPTSFSTTRIHDRSGIWIACTSLTSSIRCGCCS